MSTAAFQLRYSAPDFARLVAIEQAAALLDMDAGSIRRLCRERLQYEGLAVLTRPPDGGAEKWFIHRSFDPRLQRPGDARLIESDLSAFTAKQREQAMQRRTCVERFRHARKNFTAAMSDVLPALIEQAKADFPQLSISRSRLYAWDKAYVDRRDLVKLVDGRGGVQTAGASPEAWAAFRDFYLHENQPGVRDCWKRVRALAAAEGWTWCDYDACRRQKDARVPIQDQVKHRTPATYRQQMAPFIAQDSEAWRAGELWIGDHKQLDLVCRWGDGMVRPWLTAWMDWRTRPLVGWTLSENPNSTTILAALRHGLIQPENFGGPRCVWIDNGKDYDAWLFHGQTKQQRRERIKPNVDEPAAIGIFAALRIEAHFATPYNPNGKARLERFFRTLEAFSRTFDTYTGDSVETKPERLSNVLATPRMVPAFDAVRQRIAQHIVGYNADAEHSKDDLAEAGVTLSPNEALARWCDTRRVPADAKALDLLLMHWHRPTTVGRNGIAINLAGQTLHYGQFEQALAPFKALKKADRRPVRIAFDPHDLRTIRVHDEQWRYVCTAALNEVGGRHGDAISVKHVAELNRQKSTYEKSRRHIAQHALTSTLTNEEQLAELAVAKPPTPPSQPPSSLQIIPTPLDGQAKEIERDQLRPAAGAEGGNMPRRGLKPLAQIMRNVAPRGREQQEQPVNLLAKLRERNREW